MIANDLMEQYGMTKYRLAQIAHIPYMTVNDICNGKTSLGKCNAETVCRTAKVFDVTVEESSVLQQLQELKASEENGKHVIRNRQSIGLQETQNER